MSFYRRILRALALVVIVAGVVACGRSKGKSGEAVGAVASFDEKELWMGSFPATSGPQKVVFKFRNEGDEDLEILDVDTSCWCVSAKWPEKPVRPGKKGEVEVTVDVSEKDPGNFHHYVYFAINGTPKQFTLTVRGEITEK